VAADGHRLAVLGHPPGDPFAEPQLQAIDHVGVRRLGRSQHERVLVEHVDETGVALDDAGRELHDPGQDVMKRIGGSDTAADVVQRIDIGLGHEFDVQRERSRDRRLCRGGRRGRRCGAHRGSPHTKIHIRLEPGKGLEPTLS
jgi:hypothetical protein